jgi:hypothetical protein
VAGCLLLLRGCSVCLRRIRSGETDKGREEISQIKADRAAYLITRQPSPSLAVFFSFCSLSLVFSFLSTLNVFAAAIELVRKLNPERLLTLLKIERVIITHGFFIQLMGEVSYTNSSLYKLVWESIG